MQTETHKPLSPSYRLWFDRETERAENSGNVKAAIYALHMRGFAAYETEDGLLTYTEDNQRLPPAASYADRDWHCECPHIFPIVAGRVDMGAVAAFIGY